MLSRALWCHFHFDTSFLLVAIVAQKIMRNMLAGATGCDILIDNSN